MSRASKHDLDRSHFTALGALRDVTLVESPGHLQRRPDPTAGLALITP